MKTKSIHATSTDGARIETGIVTHNGRDFVALGSVVDHATGRVSGYVKGRTIATWDGTPIGTLREVSSWRIDSALSSRMFAYRATIDGFEYHGRGMGESMLVTLRASKA